MPKSKIIALSDIHIGTNAPTVWYQKDIHEPYLVKVLDWIIQKASSIRELILLGDVVDFWTYPPDEEPPSFDAIMAANPNVFGLNGKLSEVLTALDGKVTYVRGNHDMTITQEDLDKIQNSKGYKIQLSPEDVYYPLGNSNKKIACTHGHIYTMFNAPYTPDNITSEPIAPLPLGQLITRSVAFMRSKDLQPGQTVAQLRDSGDPDNQALLNSALPQVEEVLKSPNLPISSIILDTLSNITEMDKTQSIKLAGGKATTLEEGKKIYADLSSEWVKKEGREAAIVSLLADTTLFNNFLGWFAQKLAQDVESELVVMGHTHNPICGIANSPIKYVNTGFNCPSTVDLGNKNPTFVQIDIEACQAEILQVNGSYKVEACPAKPVDDRNETLKQIFRLANSDKKYIVEVANETKYELQRVGAVNNLGKWPLGDIPAGRKIPIEVDSYTLSNTFSFGANYRVKGGSGFIQLAASWPPTDVRQIAVGSINQDGMYPAEKVWGDMKDASDDSCSNDSVEVRAMITSQGKTIRWFYEVTER